jgi:hypothetical protein
MDSARYYAACLQALRFVETRSPTKRRFGADADARWRTFRGHLTAADRVDLLLRDADAEYPGAFAARTAFALPAVSEDDPFGPGWAPLPAHDADAMWRAVTADKSPSDVASAVQACALAWGLTLKPLDSPPVDARSRLLACGPSAVASLAAVFSRGRDLSWADQVACIATPGAHRHLANLCAALLGSNKPTRVFVTTERGVSSFDHVVVSDDADDAEREAAQTLGARA